MFAILLLNLGGPKDQDSVEDFLYHLFSDPNIFKLPAQKISAYLISKWRSPSIKKLYAKIGGGSPILKETLKQAKALEKALNNFYNEELFKVYVGMQYSSPFIEESLEAIIKDQAKKILFLPLYPQYSLSTSFSSFERIKKYFKKKVFDIPYHFVNEWYGFEDYIESISTLIVRKLNAFSHFENLYLMFSAHSIPIYMIQNGDPYKIQIENTVQKVLDSLKKKGVNYPHVLCYQSKVGPIKWLAPSTETMISSLAKKVNNCQLLIIPISFVSDHFEILYEIDMLYREHAKEENIAQFERIDSLNDEVFFIDALKNLVIHSMKVF